MKFSLSAIAFAASLAFVNAQDLTGIPTCALACFATAVPASGCELTDTKCQCTTGRDSITKSLTECAPTKCSTSEVAELAPAVQAICAKAGVTISDVPTALPSTASGASGSPTGTSASATSASGTGAAQNTGAAVANVAGMGAVAVGLFAAFGL